MSEIFGFDAFSPKEIAERVRTIGLAKARLPLLSMLMLGVLVGAFIGLGGLYFVLIKSSPSLDFVAGQLIGGLAFSLGLILVVVAGAELFTGNNLLAMAWADGEITSGGDTAELGHYLLRQFYRCNGVGTIGVSLRSYLYEWRWHRRGVYQDCSGEMQFTVLDRLLYVLCYAMSWCVWRYGWRWPGTVSLIRRWPSSFPSPRLWPPVSSTVSPICTSFRWAC
jgi:hypothetical protein